MGVRRCRRLLLVAGVLAATAAGCGDDDDGTADPPVGTWEREVTAEQATRGDPGIPTGVWRMEVREDRILYTAPDEGSVWQYVDHADGALEMGEFVQGTQSEFCPGGDAPGGRYTWERDGDELAVELDGDDPCIDRDVIVPGRWRASPASG